jgi:hypothetical protein
VLLLPLLHHYRPIRGATHTYILLEHACLYRGATLFNIYFFITDIYQQKLIHQLRKIESFACLIS